MEGKFEMYQLLGIAAIAAIAVVALVQFRRLLLSTSGLVRVLLFCFGSTISLVAPHLLSQTAVLIGFQTPSNMVLVIAIAYFVIWNFHLERSITLLEKQTKVLANVTATARQQDYGKSSE